MKPNHIQSIKDAYPPGARVELVADMSGESIYAGTRGTVQCVDDLGDIHVQWDTGRSLALIPGEDSFKKITPEYEQANPTKHTKTRGHDAR